MKLYWHQSKSQQNEYTGKLLRYWFKKWGGEIVNVDESPDAVAVSCCSLRESNIIVSARKVADDLKIPLILGGAESYIGSTFLAWADYVCVGEGYTFLKSLAQYGFEATDLDNILSRDDFQKEIIPDYFIPWSLIPCIQTAKRAYYFLHGRGCHRKCKFCFTSWTQPHSKASDKIVTRVVNKIPQGAHILYVSNDDGLLASGAGSTTLKRFLSTPDDAIKWPRVIRLGVEGITEARRAFFNKRIADDQIAMAINKAKRLSRQLQLFFIIGFDDDPQIGSFGNLVSYLETETVRHPRVYLKFTWFEPAPHTPLADFDLYKMKSWDYQKNTLDLRAISGRFRVFKAGKPGVAIWTAVSRRLPPHKMFEWYAHKRKTENLSFEDACNYASAIVGNEFVIGGSDLSPWHNIKVCTK